MHKKNFYFLLFFLIFFGTLYSCNRSISQGRLEFTEIPFGTTEGKEVTVFQLENLTKNGIVVQLTNYGASIVSIRTPDRQGKLGEITLGFDSLPAYIYHPFHGPVVGRFANRIARGRFMLDSLVFQLPLNNGPNHLHGGPGGFHTRVWEAQPFETPDSIGAVFTYLSPDGEQGYPGNLTVKACYALSRDNILSLTIEAVTDAPTIVNLTNHTFFNLTGKSGAAILNHELQILSNRYTPVDSTLIPTGEIANVAGTPMDFGQSKAIGNDIGNVPGGYDHNFVLTDSTRALKRAAVLRDPSSGRIMEVFTNQPGIQFYSGNFFDSTTVGRGGVPFPKYAGLCLEPQLFPDAPNHSHFPSAQLLPGETYFHITKYAFKIE